MKKAPPSRAGPKVLKREQFTDISYSIFDSSLQPATNASLRRLGHLRRDLDRWRAAGSRGPMPQPRQFGLRLPPMRAAEILWPGDLAHG